MTLSVSEPSPTWSNVALIAFRKSFVTLSSIAFDLGFHSGVVVRGSILIDVRAKRFDIGLLEIGVQPRDLSLTLCLLCVRETVGKPTQALVHIADQQNSRYGHQHDDEQPHRAGKAARPGVTEVVDREVDVHPPIVLL